MTAAAQTKLETKPVHDPSNWGASWHIFFGVLVIVTMIGGFGAWAVMVELEGSIPASAEVRVQSRPKPVAHTEGGVVSEILVREGDRVSAGQVLLRLDPTVPQAGLAIVAGQIESLRARQARLLAERDGVRSFQFPQDLRAAARTRPDLAEDLEDQRRLFRARRDGFDQTLAQLEQRVLQLNEQIIGASALVQASERRLATIRAELNRRRNLRARGYATQTQVDEIAMNEAEIDGEMANQRSEIARLRGQIQETRLQSTAANEQRREKAISELRDVETRLAEYQERRMIAADALQKIELVSPQDGIVESMSVFAPGAVLEPRAPALTIVPVDDTLILEARVPTIERDAIYPSQPVRVRFPSFNQRTTPEINGAVERISSDRITDPQTGMSFYTVKITIDDVERVRLGAVELSPGMPAEVYINTGARTPLSYFMKPLTDNWRKALREE